MSDMNDFFGFVGGFALISLMIAAFVFGILFVIPLGIAVAVGMVIYSHYSPNSKRNTELATIEETRVLYEKACRVAPADSEEFKQFALSSFESLQLVGVSIMLFESEGYERPAPPPPVVTGIEGGRYRDELERFLNMSHSAASYGSFKQELVEALSPFDYSIPDHSFFTARRYLSNEEIDQLVHSFFGDHQHFLPLRRILDRNFNEQNAVLPSDYRGSNCPWDYLKDTPLLEMEVRPVFVEWQEREAHTLILAGSGAGKTTLFKHMIAELLKEDCCIVVLDSQTQLIEELASLLIDDEAVTWLSPDHKLALNPFDVDEDEIKDEAVINNKISLLKFVVEHLIKAEMTSKQNTLFHHCCQLMFMIPDANVVTFKDILRDPYDYAQYIDKLDKESRNFFNRDLRSDSGGRKRGPYDSTREELSYRLDGLTRQSTFRRIFGATENTFDFYDEMLQRKLILIDTNQGLLADDSPTFGRYFVAQALQACFKRVRENKIGRPVHFFIDEAHELFDDRIERMLLQARKANVGLVLATQDFARATNAGITDTLIGSTATKIVSQVGIGDARRLASRMKCASEYLTAVPRYQFAYNSGDQRALTIRINEDPLSQLDRRDDLSALREEMEYNYGPEPDDNDGGSTAGTPPEPDPQPGDGGVSSGKHGLNDELKPEPGRKKSHNEDHDIEPSDAL